jgi:osmotically-inducible protein OsmY
MDRYNSPRGNWRRYEDEQRRRRQEREHDDEFRPGERRDWEREDRPYERGYRYDYGRGGMGSPSWGRYRDEEEMEYEEGSYVPGPYTGLGPRGYRRSDEDIFNDICSRLTDHGDIDAREIEVEVDDGEVSLFGTVDSRRTKFLAEDTIDSVPGVTEINNRLNVRRPAPGGENLRSWPRQPEIEQDEWRWRGEPGRYQERSQFGERYGEDYGYGREGERIEPESGRYQGTDFLGRYDEPEYTELDRPGPYYGIGPRGYRRSDERICEEVCERLTRHGAVDASDIEVEVQDGEVILRGTVGDRRSKRMAEDLAESTSGVRDVHNELRLSQTSYRKGEMMDWSRQVAKGQSVVGEEGDTIGEIIEVRDQDMLVSRQHLDDIYIPKDRIKAISGNRVVINIPHRKLDEQGFTVADRAQQTGRAKYVVGSEGDMIGEVVEMRDEDMLVRRSNLPDIYIPRDNIKAISGDRIVLNIAHREIQHQNWKESENQETWKRE